MDLLQVSGLVNYYGKTLESDNIHIKPVLLQKGRTKLALYGMSNVRDERLFRTFKNGKVKFFQPSTQKDDWFNLMSVHQNQYDFKTSRNSFTNSRKSSHAYTDTGYLPEEFLPSFMDLIVWGHEHECLIEPRRNPTMGFSVMQPGSSVATSLMPGEAVPKHVAVLSITGKDFKVEPIRLKTVRPFVMKEIVLQDDKEFKKKVRSTSDRTRTTQYLEKVVDELIVKAKAEWLQVQDEPEEDEELEPPLPLVRLRVEYSAPNGGTYECENPQRFSNRFVGRVANQTDVVQFHRKKAAATRKVANGVEVPDESALSQVTIDSIKIDKLVREYLVAQNLTILPQNTFGDAVSQFVDKDDKHAMEMFVTESLADQMKHLLDIDEADDEEGLSKAMNEFKAKVEEAFAAGQYRTKKSKLKPQPPNWDSDNDGPWEMQPGALYRSDDEDESDDEDATPASKTIKGRSKAAATKKAAPAKKAAPVKGGRGKKKAVEEESEDEEDAIMLDDGEDDESPLFVKPAASTRAPKRPPARKAAEPAKRATKKASASSSSKQSTLNFSQSATQANGRGGRRQEVVDDISDDDDDDDDAFEPMSAARSTRSRR